MTRVLVAGTLHVVRTRKRRSRDFMADTVAMMLEERGVIPTRYYPPMMFVTGERRDYTGNRAYIYKFRSVPKALVEAEDGASVLVEASLDEWTNGIGAYLVRPRLVNQ